MKDLEQGSCGYKATSNLELVGPDKAGIIVVEDVWGRRASGDALKDQDWEENATEHDYGTTDVVVSS